MGIDLNTNTQTNQLITSRKGSSVAETPGDAKKVSESGGDTKTREDMLSISNLASILSSSIESKAFGEVFNQQRVDEISAAIKSGKYQVKSEVVAENLFRLETEF